MKIFVGCITNQYGEVQGMRAFKTAYLLEAWVMRFIKGNWKSYYYYRCPESYDEAFSAYFFGGGAPHNVTLDELELDEGG